MVTTGAQWRPEHIQIYNTTALFHICQPLFDISFCYAKVVADRHYAPHGPEAIIASLHQTGRSMVLIYVSAPEHSQWGESVQDHASCTKDLRLLKISVTISCRCKTNVKRLMHVLLA